MSDPAERPGGRRLLRALERGEVRAAEPAPEGEPGWRVHAWVKEGILELFRRSRVRPIGPDSVREVFPFTDKEVLPPRQLTARDARRGVRLVPGGSAIRRGAFVGDGVVLMPPCYVNIGAWVGAGAMIDSHALVGTCAQVGQRVHVSAGAQLGGVLEPAGALPVIVEDDAFVGGQCGLYEGVRVGRGAVLAAGVVLTAGSVLFDLAQERELRGSPASPLVVPPNAVVVPASRPAQGRWASERGLQLACAAIVKYRDERTDAAVALEDALR